jgi:hypothetical protein
VFFSVDSSKLLGFNNGLDDALWGLTPFRVQLELEIGRFTR